jgi:hypothetical protein
MIIVYTSIIGKHDILREQKGNFKPFVDSYSEFKDDRRNSRIQKILPHLFFDAEYSIYLDGNIQLLVEPQILIDEFLKDKDVAVFRHITRDCLYDEAKACGELGLEKPELMVEQMNWYRDHGHPKHNGLYEGGVIIRRHTKEVEAMNEKWWAHYCRFGKRDQVSFPVAFPIEKINLIENSVWRHKYFKFNMHA